MRKYAGADLRHISSAISLRKSCSDNSPGAFELVKQLLGHEKVKTTVNSYAGIDTRRASRHHYRLLEKLSARTNRRPSAAQVPSAGPNLKNPNDKSEKD